jgi:hypothetical protein
MLGEQIAEGDRGQGKGDTHFLFFERVFDG